jgi:hypothetical protein
MLNIDMAHEERETSVQTCNMLFDGRIFCFFVTCASFPSTRNHGLPAISVTCGYIVPQYFLLEGVKDVSQAQLYDCFVFLMHFGVTRFNYVKHTSVVPVTVQRKTLARYIVRHR